MARIREYRKVTYTGNILYREEFAGEILEWTPGQSRIMERREAVHFLAQYKPFDREKSTGEKPFSWSQVTEEEAKAAIKVKSEPVEPKKYRNEATGQTFATQAELDKDLEGFEHLRLKEDDDLVPAGKR